MGLENKVYTKQSIIGGRLNSRSIQRFIFSIDDPEEVKQFCKITHLFFECLSVGLDGTVSVRSGERNGTILTSPRTYINYVKRMSVKHGFNMILTFDCELRSSYWNEQCLSKNRQKFFDSLVCVLKEFGADGVELNVELAKTLPFTLCEDLKKLWRLPGSGQIFLTLSNQNDWLCSGNNEFLRDILYTVDYVIFNSFGFLRYRQSSSTGQSRLEPTHESRCEDLVKVITMVEQTVRPGNLGQVLVGIDTSGCLYNNDSNGSELISLRDINRLKMANGKDVCIREIDDNLLEFTVNGVFESPKTISYDSVGERQAKLDFIRSHKLGGVVVGDLWDDLNLQYGNQSVLYQVWKDFYY
jgi:hypothetical protein